MKMGRFNKLEPSTKCKGWPKPRSGHRMCADENSLYVFGGYNPTYKTFNELWKYNSSTNNWLLLPDAERLAPSTCASSSMVIVSNNIFVFGGTGHPFARKNSSKLFMYNLKMRRWFDLSHEEALLPDLQRFQKYPRDHVKVKLCGCRNLYDVGPLPKYGQAMDHVFNKIYIHSGTQGEDFLNELHGFCLKSFRWIKYDLCSEHNRHAPIPRYRHEMIAIKERLYVLGGATPFTTFDFGHIETFDLTKKVWEKLTYPSNTNTDELPVGRKAHSCVKWDGKIYVSAGFNVDDGVLSDLWIFDMKTTQWHRLKHVSSLNKVFQQFYQSANKLFYNVAKTIYQIVWIYE